MEPSGSKVVRHTFEWFTSEDTMPRAPHSGTKGKGAVMEDRVVASCLPGWVARSLAQAGIRRLSQLSAMKDDDLLKLRGIGPRSIELIKTALKQARRNARNAS